MTIRWKQGDVLEGEADVLIVGHLQKSGKTLGGAIQQVDVALEGEIRAAIEAGEFDGTHGAVLHVRTRGRLAVQHVLVVGLGTQKALTPERVRRAAGSAARAARGLKAERVVTVALGAGQGGQDVQAAAMALAEGFALALYRFDAWKTKPEQPLTEIADFCVVEKDVKKGKQLAQGLARAQMHLVGVQQTRDLVNEGPIHMHPEALKRTAEEIAARVPGVTVKVLNRAQCQKMGMHAFLAVAAGSDAEPYFIHLTYKPKTASKKRIALVGKGITFDSGGLSLKPADFMTTMKCDMAGAATVLGVFRAFEHLSPSVEVHGVIAACENMPSGSAYRPGDVVRAMNGVSIEVLNTDAEGRVTLADALSYTSTHIQPTAIVDLATLTGACVVALGDEIVGMMTKADRLAEQLFAAAEASGEDLWELPLHEGYNELIQGQVGDVKNVGPRSAGAITAGLFLERFVDASIPWVHCDIAGPAFAERAFAPYIVPGGTGVMVRTLLHFLHDQR